MSIEARLDDSELVQTAESSGQFSSGQVSSPVHENEDIRSERPRRAVTLARRFDDYVMYSMNQAQIATTVSMIRAGMRLVPDAIYAALHCHHGLRLAGLAIVPSLIEALVVAVTSYFTLGYPTIWALCLGLV
ncbi:hypothetical protein J6590_044642 [Homalodisca vitripennis]|nr:hypothetical protein J6590_044642 [Homalodisca vitripennis]